MEKGGRLAVAKLTMREREHLCVLRPFQGVLLLQTMFWSDELRDPAEVTVDLPDVTDAELDMAETLIEAMHADADMSKFGDDYREAVMGLIQSKVAGTTLTPVAVPDPVATPDVLAGLMASVEAAKQAKAAAV